MSPTNEQARSDLAGHVVLPTLANDQNFQAGLRSASGVPEGLEDLRKRIEYLERIVLRQSELIVDMSLQARVAELERKAAGLDADLLPHRHYGEVLKCGSQP